MYICLKIWLLLLLPTLVTAATDSPTNPILRIETGMHTAPIRSISVDAAERFLLTAADDKTLRLWELETGSLLKIYRPPIGTGTSEGKIHAGALSPDGEWVAGGGWTGVEWDGKVSIYLFNRATGELIRRLTGLEEVILHLCFSPDGQYLAATLGGGWGVRVWETHTGQIVLSDTDYADSSYGCDFDAQNRLVTSADDGFIRLYVLMEGQFARVARNTALGGKQPYVVAFNPASDQLAVGFADSTQINVLSGQDLTLLYTPDTTGVDNGVLGNVDWSPEGNSLYAGGRYDKLGVHLILHWQQASQESYYTVWPASSNTITGINALKNGRMVYGAGDPSFAILDKTGNKVIEQVAAITDYRDNLTGFKLSVDGSILQFDFELGGERPARFSLTDQRLRLNPPPDNTLQPPDTTSLDIVNWDTYTPTLNDIPIELMQYERSRSLAITPDKSQFLLGTEWSLYLFDAQGQQRWYVDIPEVAWGVNISGDGQKGVAAFGDGTIRWYNLATGQELLAFFPHKEGQRWIAWTPSGYYMSSSGNADNLIGWHLNNGKEHEASFYPIGALREIYKRPDIVKKILITLDETEAIRLANLEQEKVVLPPTNLRQALQTKTAYQPVLTPSGLGKAIIVATGGEQTSNPLFPDSNQATMDMYRFLRNRGFTDGDVIYLNPLPPIVPRDGYVDQSRQDFSWRDPLVELTQAITQAKYDLQPGQQFIFYLHGHARPDFIRINQTQEISIQQLQELFAELPTDVSQILIFDTCYSGSFLDELASVPNRVVISSADTASLAWSTKTGGFSKFLINYLSSGDNLKQAFKNTLGEMNEQADIFGAQAPQLDDTQDGIYDEHDGQLANTLFLGERTSSGDIVPPTITEIHPPIQLTAGQTTATLWVKATPDFNQMRQISAILLSEQDQPADYQGENTIITRRELILQPNLKLNRYEADYDQFHTATHWKIFYQAQNSQGDWSETRVGSAERENIDLPTELTVELNQRGYDAGDSMTFKVTVAGDEFADLYVGIIFPEGYFQTITYPLNFGLMNILQPYQSGFELLLEKQNVTVLNLLKLPITLTLGDYQACALLTKPLSDPLNQENWLNFQCQPFRFE
jgi:WD40 repeat protein